MTAMTSAKTAATAAYLSLSVFYVGSPLLTVSAIGFDNIGAALVKPAFASMVLSRLLCAIACMVIIKSLHSGTPRQTLAESLAWGLVVVVTGLGLLRVAVTWPPSGSSPLVVFALIALQLWGAISTRRAFRDVSSL